MLQLLFIAATAHFQLPPGLIQAVCYTESKYKWNAIHRDDGTSNSVGICQVKLSTAKQLGFQGTEKDLLKPSVNIWYASKYLEHQLTRYNGQANLALIAYNQGSAKGLTKTRYSDKVFKAWHR